MFCFDIASLFSCSKVVVLASLVVIKRVLVSRICGASLLIKACEYEYLLFQDKSSKAHSFFVFDFFFFCGENIVGWLFCVVGNIWDEEVRDR